MIDRETVQAMRKKIEDSSRDWYSDVFFDERPKLLNKIPCHLAFAVGKATIDYLTARVSTTQDSADVLAFAGSRIVWVHASGLGSDVSTSLFTARQIESLRLNSVPNILAGPHESEGKYEILLRIGGEDFTLPLSDSDSPSNLLELENYLPTLLNTYAPVE
jgi:hypothetical protein